MHVSPIHINVDITQSTANIIRSFTISSPSIGDECSRNEAVAVYDLPGWKLKTGLWINGVLHRGQLFCVLLTFGQHAPHTLCSQFIYTGLVRVSRQIGHSLLVILKKFWWFTCLNKKELVAILRKKLMLV